MNETSTPLMRQYAAIKKEHPAALLFFRLGDFYELFFDDAVVAARELQITLTSRNKERGISVPMCGVPYHETVGEGTHSTDGRAAFATSLGVHRAGTVGRIVSQLLPERGLFGFLGALSIVAPPPRLASYASLFHRFVARELFWPPRPMQPLGVRP